MTLHPQVQHVARQAVAFVPGGENVLHHRVRPLALLPSHAHGLDMCRQSRAGAQLCNNHVPVESMAFQCKYAPLQPLDSPKCAKPRGSAQPIFHPHIAWLATGYGPPCARWAAGLPPQNIRCQAG
jgi:hypothetical protein